MGWAVRVFFASINQIHTDTTTNQVHKFIESNTIPESVRREREREREKETKKERDFILKYHIIHLSNNTVTNFFRISTAAAYFYDDDTIKIIYHHATINVLSK